MELMSINTRSGCLLLAALMCAGAAAAQQPRPPVPPGNGKIHLDVVVAPKSGPPVSDLQQQDFTVFDNKNPQPITSFKAVNGRQAPIEVIVVIDAVNAGTETVSFARAQVEKFLGVEGGHLAYPIALAVVTDKGVHMLGAFSSDGKALSTELNKDDIGLRDLGRSAGYYGAAERMQLSLDALNQLVASESPRPGRKVMIWVSPGWPMLSGPNTELGSKEQRQIFANVVALSTELRRARVTLYSVNPLGAAESVGRTDYYLEFLKGVSKPSQVSLGNLGLPVLAIQSGGLALNSSNDVARLLQECLSGAAPYYEISFDGAVAERPDEYHHLELKVAKAGLTARALQGYYAQPAAHP
jgi:VWFA-related protein